jgi:hypothetical protein
MSATLPVAVGGGNGLLRESAGKAFVKALSSWAFARVFGGNVVRGRAGFIVSMARFASF